MAEEKREIKINRDKLYGEVWQTPLSRLAKKYHISDLGLAKIWRKLAFSKFCKEFGTQLTPSSASHLQYYDAGDTF